MKKTEGPGEVPTKTKVTNKTNKDNKETQLTAVIKNLHSSSHCIRNWDILLVRAKIKRIRSWR